AKGVTVTWLSVTDPLERIEEACRGARLLAISFVQFLTGFRAPLEAIGGICQRNRCIFLVDAIQGLGAFPIDVRACHIDALAADGHKWMLGPEGCGILYVRKGRQDEIQPVEFGYTNAAVSDYAVRDMTLRPNAGRYVPGTLNTIGIFGLRAALEVILGIGVERIGAQIRATADLVVEGVTRKGYELHGNRTPESSAGIVSFRKAGQDARMIFNRLKDENVLVAARSGFVRTSPHFYISPDEVERFVALLP